MCVPIKDSTNTNATSLTSEFGMGSGVTKLLWPSTLVIKFHIINLSIHHNNFYKPLPTRNSMKHPYPKSFHSSVQKKGKIVTQITHFSNGNIKTFKGILTSTILQSEFTQFELIDGRRIYINTKNVDCFEVIPETIDNQ